MPAEVGARRHGAAVWLHPLRVDSHWTFPERRTAGGKALRVDEQIRIAQENLRDHLRVRHGWVNVADKYFDEVLPPELQRIFGANGLLRLVCDGEQGERMWAINLGDGGK
jgi:hypothetical protein